MKKQQGFTLIEVTVVISIIGLLASVLLVSFVGVREKARDSRRLADMRQVITALDIYYNEYGRYPDVSASGSGCSGWDTSKTPDAFLQSLINEKIITKPPVDPLNSGGCAFNQKSGTFFANLLIDKAIASTAPRKPQGIVYVYRYEMAGNNGCDPSKGNYYVLGIPKMETVTGKHPSSPGFTCNDPNEPWVNFAWVAGKFEK